MAGINRSPESAALGATPVKHLQAKSAAHFEALRVALWLARVLVWD
jgi:hypothetical protein